MEERSWYIVGFYLAPGDGVTIRDAKAEMREQPRGFVKLIHFSIRDPILCLVIFIIRTWIYSSLSDYMIRIIQPIYFQVYITIPNITSFNK